MRTSPPNPAPGEARSHIGDTKTIDGGALKRLFDEMEAEGFARLRASFEGPALTTRSADMRYGEQVFEIAVPLDAAAAIEEEDDFHRDVGRSAAGALEVRDLLRASIF